MRRWQPPSAVACPATRRAIPWAGFWAQAETVTLCLHLTYGLQAGDDARCSMSLRPCSSRSHRETDGGPQPHCPRVWISRGVAITGRRAAQPRLAARIQ